MNFENFKEKNKIRWYQLDDLKCEKWIDIKDYEGMYKVSNYGRVKSVERMVDFGKQKRTIKEKILNNRVGSDLRFYANLSKNKKSIYFQVHRLVLQNFVGECPKGMECCHGNGVKTDNRLKNLRWDTHKNNVLDKIKHGQTTLGIKNPCAKLNENDIKEILELLKTKNYYYREIAKMYNVCIKTIGNIKNKLIWKHINLE